MTDISINGLKNKYLSRKVVFVLDFVISCLCSIVVVIACRELVFYDFKPLYSPRFMAVYMLATLFGAVLGFSLRKTYCIIIRRLSIKDQLPFFTACLLKFAVGLVGVLIFGLYSNQVLIILILDSILTYIGLIGVRTAMILVYDYINSRTQEKYEHMRIMVYGTSDKSVATIVRLKNSPHYKLVGFLTSDTSVKDVKIDSLPVCAFQTDEELKELIIKDYRLDAVLFANEIDAREQEEGIIRVCRSSGVKTLIVPSVDDVEASLHPEAQFHPREIKVEDLLGRKEIKISMEVIEQNFKNKVVLVTGAAGSIGSELCRQLCTFGIKKIVLFDNAETPMHNIRLELEEKYKDIIAPVIGDVRSPNRLEYVFSKYHPQVVFHAAAYKHVPLMEENPCEAVLVNDYGTKNVADKCIEYDVEKMVMISTDKAVNPTNIMGCTKRLAEIYVQSLGLAVESGRTKGKTKFVTTRFGNVLGSNGSVIPRFAEQIAKGGPVTVTHKDITRFFMTIPEACRLVMEAATMSTGNQIFVFDMGQSVKIDHLARRMITLAGYVPDKDIKIEYSGLRPGEKLYEEVLSDKENTLPTFHERIRIAKVREYSYDDANRTFEVLTKLANEVDIIELVRLMKVTVPEYKSDNSVFQAIDAELEGDGVSDKLSKLLAMGVVKLDKDKAAASEGQAPSQEEPTPEEPAAKSGDDASVASAPSEPERK